ncbi:MAG: gamma-glutamylcyclotransferase family protein [Candidatus Hodarchaeales archaeon]|jgi:gamma-glutamylcyclotransferase (GGCT)/AIG2-like uncharacterized protein YtfP
MEKDKDSENIENEEKCDRLFVYGTLQSGYSRNYLLEGLTFEKAVLLRHRKATPPNLGFPFIVLDKNSEVEGEIYYGLTQSHWEQIDLVEGEGSLYHRIIVEVETFSKLERRKISTFVYFPSESLIKRFL